MRKSLAIIASALLLAVAAATHDRLRYDSTVFADAAVAGAERAMRVEYPPCKKGVREDRCIQLYERGVKRSYQKWLASHGRGATQTAAGSGRTYRACRGRNDDRCQQRASTRQARTVRRAQRRAVARRAPAQTRQVTRATARQQRATARQQRTATRQQRTTVQRQAARTPAPQQRRSGGATPGI